VNRTGISARIAIVPSSAFSTTLSCCTSPSAERDHHAPARRQLLDQLRRRLGRGGGDEDRVERRVLGPAARAVAARTATL
jgi:hypothetical protein